MEVESNGRSPFDRLRGCCMYTRLSLSLSLSSLFDSKCRLPAVTTPVLHRCLRSFPLLPRASSRHWLSVSVGSRISRSLGSAFQSCHSRLFLLPGRSSTSHFREGKRFVSRSNESSVSRVYYYRRFEYICLTSPMGSLIFRVSHSGSRTVHTYGDNAETKNYCPSFRKR